MNKAIHSSRPFMANRHRYCRPVLEFRMKSLWVSIALPSADHATPGAFQKGRFDTFEVGEVWLAMQPHGVSHKISIDKRTG